MSQTERSLSESIDSLVAELDQVKSDMANLAAKAANDPSFDIGHSEPFIITGLTVFVLACIVGYYVVWRVTPALHSPLMGITNAISSVIIVGALTALAPVDGSFSFMAFLGVIFASINIFGGFIIT